ncbi:hypothetical protein ABZ154_18835 [Streptomyces sp. NPDC006261]|uniref:GNAT family N-acetyltransferase n=1 Tax=Streptomyces sp. NPDC006261 TaxID=3156739 RepID=UPI0033BC62A2
MTRARALSTPPVIAAGSLAAAPQPVLTAAGGLVLRPWADGGAPAFLAAYRDDEIRRWHTRRPLSEAQAREWSDHGLQLPDDPVASVEVLRQAVSRLDRFVGSLGRAEEEGGE